MSDSKTNSDELQSLQVGAADLNRVVPKLANRVLIGKSGTNTLLTFVVDLGNNQAQVIETIAVDPVLHKGLLKLLEDEQNKEESN